MSVFRVAVGNDPVWIEGTCSGYRLFSGASGLFMIPAVIYAGKGVNWWHYPERHWCCCCCVVSKRMLVEGHW